jgi:hypothetical protein
MTITKRRTGKTLANVRVSIVEVLKASLDWIAARKVGHNLRCTAAKTAGEQPPAP